MKYDKIVRAGICGCGNIVVEQVLNYLFDQNNNAIDKTKSTFHRPANSSDRVIHTFRYLDNLEPANIHHLSDLDKLHLGIIIPIRDFRSALASMMRKEQIPPNEQGIRHMYNSLFIHMYRQTMRYKTEYKYQEDILWLDYSKYFCNFDYLLCKLEQFLEINIDKTKKAKIAQQFDINNNKKIANTMNSWNQIDTISGVHGRHIGIGHPESWKTFFPENLHKFVTNLMLSELTQYGWK